MKQKYKLLRTRSRRSTPVTSKLSAQTGESYRLRRAIQLTVLVSCFMIPLCFWYGYAYTPQSRHPALVPSAKMHITNTRQRYEMLGNQLVVLNRRDWLIKNMLLGERLKRIGRMSRFSLPKNATIDKRRIEDFAILYTRQRSGSSFVGGLFSHHPDIYYTFEPMNFVKSSKTEGDINKTEIVSQRLKEIAQCDFQNLLTHSIKSPYWRSVSFCSRFNSRSVVHGLCARTTIAGWQRICKMYQYALTKDIVIQSLQNMAPLISEGYKILHLVRDPRGVANSRINLITSPAEKRNKTARTIKYTKVAQQIVLECQQTQRDLDYIQSLLANNTHPKYHVIRYEDIAFDPERSAKRLYEFVGFPYSDSIDKWINVSTNLDDSRYKEATQSYTILRNSRKVAMLWYYTLPRDIVQIIETGCVDMMTSLGYRNISRTAAVRANEPVDHELLGDVVSPYAALTL